MSGLDFRPVFSVILTGLDLSKTIQRYILPVPSHKGKKRLRQFIFCTNNRSAMETLPSVSIIVSSVKNITQHIQHL